MSATKRYVVGSTLKKRAHLARLPSRSVVINSFGNPMIVRGDQSIGWLGNTSTVVDVEHLANPPYTVIYLP